MKLNPNTEFYLKDLERKGKAQTEALKKLAKKTAQRTLLGTVLLGLILAGLVYALKAVNDFFSQNTLIIKSPIEISTKINRIISIARRVPATIKVAVTDDQLVDSFESHEDYYEIAKRTGNTEAALYAIGLFRDVKEGPVEMIATFMAESGFKNDAMNWNCIYYGADGKPYSKACEIADREKAWSVDCGIAQLNFSGKECPADSFNPIWNLTMARAKYNRQGIGAWVANGNDSFLRYMAMLTQK